MEKFVVKDTIGSITDKVRRLKIPLDIYRRELGWEKEHIAVTGREDPQALNNLSSLWHIFKNCSSIFRENQAFNNACGDGEIEYEIVQLRQAVMEKLNKICELLTPSTTVGNISKAVTDAYELASQSCVDYVPKLTATLKNASERLKQAKI